MPGNPPPRRMRNRVAALSGVVVLGVSGATLGLFGVYDLFGDTDYGVRLRAALMLAVAVYIVVGAATLAWVDVHQGGVGGPGASALVLTAAVITASFGALLAIYQLVAGDYTSWLWVWIGMIAAGAVVTGLLVRWGARIGYPRQFAVAVTVTTLLAGANFAYTTLYQPAAEPVQFTVEVAIGKPALSPSRPFATVPFTVSFANTGGAGVTVIMSTFSVVGRHGRLSPVDRTRPEVNLDVQRGHAASQRTVVDGYDVLQSDSFIFPGTEFTSGDRAVVERILDVPLPTAYDSLAVNAWVLVLRTDDVRLRTDISLAHHSWDPRTGEHREDAPDWAAAPGIDWSRHEIPIDETSFLRTKIRQRWTGYVWVVASDPAPGRPPGSYLSFRFTPSGQAATDKRTADDENQIAAQRYGLARSQTGITEKSVVELGLGP